MAPLRFLLLGWVPLQAWSQDRIVACSDLLPDNSGCICLGHGLGSYSHDMVTTQDCGTGNRFSVEIADGTSVTEGSFRIRAILRHSSPCLEARPYLADNSTYTLHLGDCVPERAEQTFTLQPIDLRDKQLCLAGQPNVCLVYAASIIFLGPERRALFANPPELAIKPHSGFPGGYSFWQTSVEFDMHMIDTLTLVTCAFVGLCPLTILAAVCWHRSAALEVWHQLVGLLSKWLRFFRCAKGKDLHSVSVEKIAAEARLARAQVGVILTVFMMWVALCVHLPRLLATRGFRLSNRQPCRLSFFRSGSPPLS